MYRVSVAHARRAQSILLTRRESTGYVHVPPTAANRNHEAPPPHAPAPPTTTLHSYRPAVDTPSSNPHISTCRDSTLVRISRRDEELASSVPASLPPADFNMPATTPSRPDQRPNSPLLPTTLLHQAPPTEHAEHLYLIRAQNTISEIETKLKFRCRRRQTVATVVHVLVPGNPHANSWNSWHERYRSVHILGYVVERSKTKRLMCLT